MMRVMPRHKLHSSLALAGVVAAMRITRALFGFGGGGDGVLDAAFSAADAPNGPSTLPTLAGSGGAASGSPSPGGEGDGDGTTAPEGFESWFDFLDWSAWSTVKGVQPAPVGLGIELLELGAPIGDTLIKVKENHRRKRDLLNTDYRGTSKLTGGSDD
jgi:hypothetical protein